MANNIYKHVEHASHQQDNICLMSKDINVIIDPDSQVGTSS